MKNYVNQSSCSTLLGVCQLYFLATTTTCTTTNALTLKWGACAFSALTLLAGRQEVHPASKK